MPRTKAQFQHLRTEMRKNLLEAAIHVFARKGYSNATVQDIATQAGVSKGLLYNYFNSKEAVLESILNLLFEQVGQTFLAVPPNATPKEALKALSLAAFGAVENNRLAWQVCYGVRWQPEVMQSAGPQLRVQAGEIRKKLRRIFKSYGRARAEGLAHVVFAAIDGGCQHFVMEPSRFPLQAFLDSLMELLPDAD